MQNRQFFKTYGRLLTVITLGAVIAVVSLGVHAYKQNHAAKSAYVTRQACSILTAAVAQSVSSDSLVGQAIKPISTDSTATTYCVYRGSATSVSLVVRSAKNQQGVELNHDAFSSPPTSSVMVHGYGDAAYWSPAFAQLNILEHDTWYILSDGSTTPSQRTLGQTEKFADKIVNRL